MSGAKRMPIDFSQVKCSPSTKAGHTMRPHADGQGIWSVCTKCGYQDQKVSHREIYLDQLAYVFRDL